MSFWSFVLTEETSESREFLQARLVLFMRLVALLSGGFYLANLAVAAALGSDELVDTLTHSSAIAHLVGTLIATGCWAMARRPGASARALDALDFGGTFGICLMYGLMIPGETVGHEAETAALLATSWTLVTRAALVPTQTRRTAAIGVVSLVPCVAASYYAARQTGGEPALRAINVAFWAVVAVAVTSVISRIIYGLRRRVQEAMRVGQYTLIEKLGAGAMGVVYRASHAMLRRPTAIKILPPDRADALEIQRFEREVQLTSLLTHPNTVAIYDFGRTPDGLFYYAMELLEGISLEQLVRGHGPQPPARVVHILTQCCGALQEAHDAGLVHRDIKPANVMLTSRGGAFDVVKVVDFGLVKSIHATSADESHSGNVAGTPQYLAPEAIRDPTCVDGRTDLYALGATAYFLLTAKTVFEGGTVIEVCSQHLYEEPVPPSQRESGIPPDLETIILRCLAKDPAQRHQSAALLADELRGLSVGAWSANDAKAWWTTHGTEAIGAAQASATVVSGERTMRVDASGRD